MDGDDEVRRMPQDARALLMAAVDEAVVAGSATVEAQHLLLALVSRPGPIARRFAEAGLDRDGVAAALRAEREASLAYAGASLPPDDRLAATPGRARPRFGTTVREAMHTGYRILSRTDARRNAGRTLRREPDRAVAVGLLAARLGTVPRALALAGIDRERLAADIRML